MRLAASGPPYRPGLLEQLQERLCSFLLTHVILASSRCSFESQMTLMKITCAQTSIRTGVMLQVSVDGETSQTIISGMGELHLEVYVERMRREYDVRAQ